MAAWNGREDVTELAARADLALYAAKAGGRNRCHADRDPAARPAAQAPTG